MFFPELLAGAGDASLQASSKGRRARGPRRVPIFPAMTRRCRARTPGGTPAGTPAVRHLV